MWFEPSRKSALKVLKFSKRPNPRHPKKQTTELRDKRKVLNQTRPVEIFLNYPKYKHLKKSLGWKMVISVAWLEMSTRIFIGRNLGLIHPLALPGFAKKTLKQRQRLLAEHAGGHLAAVVQRRI